MSVGRMQVVNTVLALALAAGLAQVAQAQSSSQSWGSWGSLTWDWANGGGTCGPMGRYTYDSTVYSDFVYTGPDGTKYDLIEGGTAYYTSAPLGYCPPNRLATFDDNAVGGGYEITFTGGWGGGGSATLNLEGALTPRYQLLSLLYAPPGHASSVEYAGTTAIGTSTDISRSFTSGSNFSIKFGVGYNAKCGAGAGGTLQICGTDGLPTTAGGGFTQVKDSSQTTDVSQQQGYTITIYGPQPNGCLGQTDTQMDDLGLDHDYDQFIVWLNPAVNISGAPSGALYWTGYSFNGEDPAQNIDSVTLSPGQLKDPNFPADLDNQGIEGGCYYQPGFYAKLQRGWDTSGTAGGAALTAADYQAILAAEPWANDPHATSTPLDTARFSGPLNALELQYETNQLATGYSACYNSGFATNLGETDTYSVQSGLQVHFSFFGGLISGSLTDASAMTNQSGWSSTNSQKVGQCATISITGPPGGSGYSGPTQFNVYQDNVFGTFMIWPVQ